MREQGLLDGSRLPCAGSCGPQTQPVCHWGHQTPPGLPAFNGRLKPPGICNTMMITKTFFVVIICSIQRQVEASSIAAGS